MGGRDGDDGGDKVSAACGGSNLVAGMGDGRTAQVEADSLFVYAVKTTGIFCRPSCPSRRPLRESVEFFATGELARAAGYRACKRCQPGEEHPQQKLVGLACDYIDRNPETTITLEALGKLMGLSPFHAQRLFRRTLGVTPKQYQQARRMDRFRAEFGKDSKGRPM